MYFSVDWRDRFLYSMLFCCLSLPSWLWLSYLVLADSESEMFCPSRMRNAGRFWIFVKFSVDEFCLRCEYLRGYDC